MWIQRPLPTPTPTMWHCRARGAPQVMGKAGITEDGFGRGWERDTCLHVGRD